ncbi:MAG: UpxY family transcription antiterminator [Prevotellaceae bacterium]|nr:UpxY family transcription antiterminator [Prevotella sp.]MDD7257059.1 UpxY family transcription antiterminator [Prevotellaceae bacterium]MDY6130429.1 UpxY family transcription antiterminator [Prevotella sp.]
MEIATPTENTGQDIQEDRTPWYGLQLFGVRQKELSEVLEQNNIDSFYPVQMVDFIDREGKLRHELRPVVSNLLFVKKPIDTQNSLQEILKTYQNKYYVIRKTKGARDFYEIPAYQMQEFMTMCNPELTMKKFLSEGEAKLKKGDRVQVSHGPLKGMTGRLVRQSGKYFLLKEIPGMAVMLKVTRWCCQKAEDS